jgi:hypothetical protein
MKNTYAWGLIVLALIIVGGAYWFIVNSNNSPAVEGVGVTPGTQTQPVTKGGTHTTKPGTVTSTGGSGTTGTTDSRPKIVSLTPMSGKVGDVITIKGMNFDSTSNIITFGPSAGRHHVDGSPDNQISAISSSDGMTLTFLVPASGPSGQLCTQSDQCVAISAVHTVPGSYAVSIVNKNGLSNTMMFTVTQ